MELKPLHIVGKCVSSDDTLYEHIRHAMTLGLPEIDKMEEVKASSVAIVGSGPSILTQVEVIRAKQAAGIPIVAVRDSHDWLISHGIIPDYALSVDPLESAAECFARPHPGTEYLIASQSHAKMFENLAGMNIRLWHCYFKKGQTEPKGRIFITGAWTSGMRAIVVMYVLGYRTFDIFGLDSCLQGDNLRMNGTGVPAGETISEVKIEPDGKLFYCNPAMALQAQAFQDLYWQLPDAEFRGYGEGLVQAIIEKRRQNRIELDTQPKSPDNGRVSFIHAGPTTMASYRYRAKIPAEMIGASINDLTASTLVFSKPRPDELMDMARAKMRGQRVVVDFCDDHFPLLHYQTALKIADAVTCPTEAMAELILNHERFPRKATVIPDPWEYPLYPAHFAGMRLLWYGHEVNKKSLQRIMPDLEGYALRVVSNFGGAIPWSHATMLMEFANADIVVMPASDQYKSANRTVEALRQGCFIIAEPHPAILDIPGIWIGNIKEGLEWVKQQSMCEMNRRITSAQTYVTEKYSPKTWGATWRSVTRSPITSDAAPSYGLDGLTSIPEAVPT